MVSHEEARKRSKADIPRGCDWLARGREGWLRLQAGVGEGGPGAGAGQGAMSRRVCDPQQLCVVVRMTAISLGELEGSEYLGGCPQTVCAGRASCSLGTGDWGC